MATLEDEIKVLKEQNNELAQKVQYWKMTAGERENEKLSLMKEMNELRLKLSRLRNNGGYETRKLDASLQQASEKAISHLVQASAEIARSMEIAKAYVRERQEMNAQSPRWSSLGGTPPAERSEKVHRVPPMMMGGQSIQPVVSLSRTLLNTSNPRTGPRSPNQNRNTTERALPMYMLQDVYIPLTRIDITDVPNNNMDNDAEGNTDDSEEEGMEDVEEGLDESARMSEDDEFPNRKLHALSEEESDLEDSEAPRLSLQIDNPLEGPSWLLDTPPDSRSSNPQSGRGSGVNLEPDSTTEPDHTPHTSTQKADHNVQRESTVAASVRRSCEFSPTVRRRKRVSSPPAGTPRQQHYSPRPPSLKKNSNSGRVLKVMVAKMRLDAAADADGEGEGEGAGDAEGTSSPPKRLCSPRDARLTFDAPSPNGATDSAVIVSETRTHLQTAEIKIEPVPSPRRESYEALRCRVNSQDSRSSHHSRLSQDNFDQHRLTESCQREREDSRVRERLKSERDSVQCSRLGSHDSRDSDSGSGGGGDSISNGRTRRPRKMVTYKEKPLNRKLRR